MNPFLGPFVSPVLKMKLLSTNLVSISLFGYFMLLSKWAQSLAGERESRTRRLAGRVGLVISCIELRQIQEEVRKVKTVLGFITYRGGLFTP